MHAALREGLSFLCLWTRIKEWQRVISAGSLSVLALGACMQKYGTSVFHSFELLERVNQLLFTQFCINYNADAYKAQGFGMEPIHLTTAITDFAIRSDMPKETNIFFPFLGKMGF